MPQSHANIQLCLRYLASCDKRDCGKVLSHPSILYILLGKGEMGAVNEIIVQSICCRYFFWSSHYFCCPSLFQFCTPFKDVLHTVLRPCWDINKKIDNFLACISLRITLLFQKHLFMSVKLCYIWLMYFYNRLLGLLGTRCLNIVFCFNFFNAWMIHECSVLGGVSNQKTQNFFRFKDWTENE